MFSEGWDKIGLVLNLRLKTNPRFKTKAEVLVIACALSSCARAFIGVLFLKAHFIIFLLGRISYPLAQPDVVF